MIGLQQASPHYTPHRLHRRCMIITFGVPVLIFLLNYYECYNSPIVIGVVYGWGQKGHEIVGNVASALLSQRTLRQIELLLNVSSTNHTSTDSTSASTGAASGIHITPPEFMNQECVEYCTPLAIVADWADQVRFYKKWSAPLHYVDVRDDLIVPNGCPVVVQPLDLVTTTAVSEEHYTKCSFNYTRDCPDDICAVGAIMNYTKQLYDGYTLFDNDDNVTSLPSALRESLMFLVHFMGDIHQPLHCSRTTDRGGNNIHVHYYHGDDFEKMHRDHSPSTMNSHLQQQQFQSQQLSHVNKYYIRDYRSQRQRRRTLRGPISSSHHSSLNLHAVWDDSIIETILERDFQYSRNAFEVSLLLYIHDIRTNHPSIYKDLWLQCSDATDIHCVSIWGEESFDLAMQYAYANVDGSEIVDGATLEEEYYLTRHTIVRMQLAIAAVRLAANLARIFT